MIENWSLRICHLQLSCASRTPQLQMTSFQLPILNCIFLFSLLLALPLVSAAQTNSSTPPQPSQPISPPANPAPAAPAEEANLTFNFTLPIGQFLEEVYAPLVGRTPLRAPNTPTNTFITLNVWKPLTKSQAIMALEAEMGMNGITVVPMGEKFFKVVVISGPQGAASANASSNDLLLGRFSIEVVQLKYADPDEVVKALSSVSKTHNSVVYIPSTGSLILRDYTENVKRMLEMVEKLDVEPVPTVKSEVIPIQVALAKDIAVALSQLGAGPGGSAGRGGSIRQGGGTGNIFLFGKTRIIADERTNSLLVFATDEDMKMIKKIIKALDEPLGDWRDIR
jgi:type II secretory pathway component GspD/PulD (secretin)